MKEMSDQPITTEKTRPSEPIIKPELPLSAKVALSIAFFLTACSGTDLISTTQALDQSDPKPEESLPISDTNTHQTVAKEGDSLTTLVPKAFEPRYPHQEIRLTDFTNFGVLVEKKDPAGNTDQVVWVLDKTSFEAIGILPSTIELIHPGDVVHVGTVQEVTDLVGAEFDFNSPNYDIIKILSNIQVNETGDKTTIITVVGGPFDEPAVIENISHINSSLDEGWTINLSRYCQNKDSSETFKWEKVLEIMNSGKPFSEAATEVANPIPTP